MKSYPSIPGPKEIKEIQGAYIFDKLDGSNLRFEWNRKSGWNKYGTRTRLFDETDEVFGEAIAIWHRDWAEPLGKVFRGQRYDKAVAFAEFYGPSSFAGVHVKEEPKTLTLFDVCKNTYGFLEPKEFLKLFEHLPIVRYIMCGNYNRGFVEEVYDNEIPGITFEGIVAKKSGGAKAVRAKAKTKQWLDKIKALGHPIEDGDFLDPFRKEE